MWPSLAALAEKHEDDPIVFVAVSSGTQKEEMKGYIKTANVTWPLIHDVDRSFESACDVDKISLQNIHQVRFVTGGGEILTGNWQKLDWTVDYALKDAKWRIDPADIPETLKAAWRAVESRKYGGAAPAILSALKAKDAETQAAAKLLYDATMKDMRKRGSEAWALGKSGSKWTAYMALDAFCTDFDGFPIPKKVVSARDKLAENPRILDEAKARKLLSAAQGMAATDDPKKVATARKRLQSLLKRYPDSEAATDANELLENLADAKAE